MLRELTIYWLGVCLHISFTIIPYLPTLFALKCLSNIFQNQTWLKLPSYWHLKHLNIYRSIPLWPYFYFWIFNFYLGEGGGAICILNWEEFKKSNNAQLIQHLQYIGQIIIIWCYFSLIHLGKGWWTVQYRAALTGEWYCIVQQDIRMYLDDK
jgi:hypothetical protein